MNELKSEELITVDLHVRVTVNTAKLRPSSVDAGEHPYVMASRMVEDKCLSGLQWVNGFHELVHARTTVIPHEMRLRDGAAEERTSKE